MRTLISYYGGKQRIVDKILPLIPSHVTYCEPFAGGATVFFSKPLATVNVLNDKSKWLVNMYIQYKKHTKKFIKILSNLPFSEHLYQSAKKYKIKNKLIAAVRYWYNINFSFSCNLNAGWSGLNRSHKAYTVFNNKIKQLSEKINKLKYTTIYCRDALFVINFYDSEDTFFYIDPPYPNSDQGHYSGYTIEDYQKLIDKLKTIKGKFMLSNYHQDIQIPENWYIKEIKTFMSACKTKRESRTELLIMNYKPEQTLFD